MPQALGLKNKKYYLFGDFPGSNLISAFTTRFSGNTSLYYGETLNSLKNRRDSLKGLRIDYRRLVCAEQVHASTVKYAREQDAGRGALSGENAIAGTDALITDKKDLPLSIFTADCLSIFLFDPKTPSIGLVHAGWRGSSEKIAAKTVESMRQQFNTETEYLYAAFGPAIRRCCYEVGPEFINLFAPEYLSASSNRYYLDLAKINRNQLLSLGIKDEKIFDSNICTDCRNEEFFSYRKEGAGSGRTMSVMMLR